MKVEHITFKGNSTIRNTDDVWPKTKEFFKPFQKGNITQKIDNTPFTCKVTVDRNIAIFDLYVDKDILCTNICCFSKEDTEPALLYAKEITSQIDRNHLLITPKEDCFIISIIINPLIALSDLALAGEIELYIYDAIYEGLKDNLNQPENKQNTMAFEKFEVGKLFPWQEYIGHGDATIPVFNKNFFDVVVSMVEPTPDEIKSFRKGQLEVGLFIMEDVPFLYLDFGKFSLDASLNINKLSKQEEIDNWLNKDSNIINLFLIDGTTGILMANRMISINFSETIRDVIEEETKYTIEETDAIINRVSMNYTTAQMQRNAIKRMTFK